MEYRELHEMDPFKFEVFVGEVFVLLKYNVLITSQTSDGGVDVIVDQYDTNFKKWTRYVIQVKRYKTPIGIERIRELNGVLDLHNANFGCLITLSDFKKGIKEKSRTDYPKITLQDGNDFFNLLKSAGMIDAEENINFSTDPNHERNRLFSIIKILYRKQPESTKADEIIKTLKSEFYITVSEKIIREDIKKLEEDGYIINIDNSLFYKPKQSEIIIILSNLESILKEVDYFLTSRVIYRILEDNSRINREIWRIYFSQNLQTQLDTLVRNGILLSVGNDSYATKKALEVFRTVIITEEELKHNLDKILEVNKDNIDTPIKDLNILPPEKKGRIIKGIDEESKKLLPFIEIFLTVCQHCNGLIAATVDRICYYVTSTEIENKIQKLTEESRIDEILELQKRKFDMSSSFLNRLKESFSKYFSDFEGIDITLHKLPVLVVQVYFEITKESTLGMLRDSVFEICRRYQSFTNEIFAPIEEYGRPIGILTFNDKEESEFVDVEYEE